MVENSWIEKSRVEKFGVEKSGLNLTILWRDFEFCSGMLLSRSDAACGWAGGL